MLITGATPEAVGLPRRSAYFPAVAPKKPGGTRPNAGSSQSGLQDYLPKAGAAAGKYADRRGSPTASGVAPVISTATYLFVKQFRL